MARVLDVLSIPQCNSGGDLLLTVNFFSPFEAGGGGGGGWEGRVGCLVQFRLGARSCVTAQCQQCLRLLS